MSNKLTHINADGKAQMVDVGHKSITTRIAKAQAVVKMDDKTLDLIISGEHKKGDVLAVASVAGIMAAKKCSNLIPLCHQLTLSQVSIDLAPNDVGIKIIATAKLNGKTGVEMEALTAASIAALTIYDMCKAVDKTMIIGEICILEKSGGKSKYFLADE